MYVNNYSLSRKCCKAPNCASNNVQKRKISYFNFPQNASRFKVWIDRCGNQELMGKTPYECRNLHLCADHFTLESFMNIHRNRLVHDAVPSIFPDGHNGSPVSSSRIDEIECAIPSGPLESMVELQVEPQIDLPTPPTCSSEGRRNSSIQHDLTELLGTGNPFITTVNEKVTAPSISAIKKLHLPPDIAWESVAKNILRNNLPVKLDKEYITVATSKDVTCYIDRSYNVRLTVYDSEIGREHEIWNVLPKKIVNSNEPSYIYGLKVVTKLWRICPTRIQLQVARDFQYNFTLEHFKIDLTSLTNASKDCKILSFHDVCISCRNFGSDKKFNEV